MVGCTDSGKAIGNLMVHWEEEGRRHVEILLASLYWVLLMFTWQSAHKYLGEGEITKTNHSEVFLLVGIFKS